MQYAYTLVTLGLASLAAALPTPNDKPTSTWKNGQGAEVVSYVSKFDNANAGLVGNLPVRPVQPLGPYNDLYYNLNVINVGQGAAGVKPESAPNVIVFDSISTLTEGAPTISADFDDSIAESFNLKNFYFGCVVTNAETAASLPASCTLTVTGYRNEKEVASQDFNFDPSGLLTLAAVMQKAYLKGFGNVDKVEFSLDNAAEAALDAVLIDNVAYDVTLMKGISPQ